MCRSTTEFHSFNRIDRNRLTIKAFFVKLSGLRPEYPVPKSLTLLYLPRINGTEMEINGSKIKPDSHGFVTLHRVLNEKTRNGEALYGTRERVRVCDGVRFDVYLRDDKLLKGVFRRVDEHQWSMDCSCGLEREFDDVAAAEAYVAAERHVAMRERVEMVVKRRRKCCLLEDIPEGREVDEKEYVPEGDECGCEMDNGYSEKDVDLDLEGVGWAVNLGIWAVSLGVGYLVSRASAKSLRRLRIL